MQLNFSLLIDYVAQESERCAIVCKKYKGGVKIKKRNDEVFSWVHASGN